MGTANSGVPDENPESPLIKKQINRQMQFNTLSSKELTTRSCFQSKHCLTPLKHDFSSGKEVRGQTPKTVPKHNLRKFELDQRGTSANAYINSRYYSSPPSKKLSEEEKVIEGQSGDACRTSKVDIILGFDEKDIFSSLPSDILFKVVSYAISNFKSIIRVNPLWCRLIMDSFDIEFNELEMKFANKYANYLLYKQASISYTRIKSCEIPGVRVDRVIRFEPLETIKGKTITFGYSFKYTGDSKNRYKVIFTFDVLKMQARTVWAYLNECNVSVFIESSFMEMIKVKLVLKWLLLFVLVIMVNLPLTFIISKDSLISHLSFGYL
jgi:hypothetical protein